jgi:ribose 5-phosphate isomerase B
MSTQEQTDRYEIAIGADEFGMELKEHLVRFLRGRSIPVLDKRAERKTCLAYPDIALQIASLVTTGSVARGILICGTGIGMAITANKVPGIRAAVCHDLYSAQYSRQSNNCQIICLGAKIISPEEAGRLLDMWLGSELKADRSIRKLKRIAEIENEFRRNPSAERINPDALT